MVGGARGTRNTRRGEACAGSTQVPTDGSEGVFAVGSGENLRIRQDPGFDPVNFTIVEDEAELDGGRAWLDEMLSAPNREAQLASRVATSVAFPAENSSHVVQPRAGSDVRVVAMAIAVGALLVGLGFLLF
jgi:hypothetical protein